MHLDNDLSYTKWKSNTAQFIQNNNQENIILNIIRVYRNSSYQC